MMADQNHRSRLKQIVDLYKAGQKSEATRLIGEIIKANPNDADAWYIAGQVSEESARKIKLFERALAINPSHQAARSALNNLRQAYELLGTAISNNEGLLDDRSAVPATTFSTQPRPVSEVFRLDLANPRMIAVILSATLLVGIFIGALCLGTVNSGRILGIVFAPTVTPSKTLTPTPTFTPSITPTPTHDVPGTSTALASTQQSFDSTATALALLSIQDLAATQVAQMTTTIVVNSDQVEAAIDATQRAEYRFYPTPTPAPGDVITQTLIPVESSYTSFGFSPVDIEYTPVLDRIILVSANPNQLHIFNPNTAEDTVVELPRAPTSVSVGPEGLFAAVGHDALISYIDLQNARVLNMLDITVEVGQLALGGNGWIYAVPYRPQGEHIRAINITSNVEVLGPNISSDSKVRLHPDGNRIYSATSTGSIPADIDRFNFEDSVPVLVVNSRYHGNYPECGDLWFSADGSRIFTACGTVFTLSQIPKDDMIYNGTLAGLRLVAYMVHVPSTARIMGVSATDHTLAVWDDETYTLVSAFQLPDMVINGQPVPVIGHSLFVDSAETHYYAIARTGENNGDAFGLLVTDLPR
jgi:WD40 repeat protein